MLDQDNQQQIETEIMANNYRLRNEGILNSALLLLAAIPTMMFREHSLDVLDTMKVMHSILTVVHFSKSMNLITSFFEVEEESGKFQHVKELFAIALMTYANIEIATLNLQTI